MEHTVGPDGHWRLGTGVPGLAGRFAPLIFLGVLMLIFAVLEPRFLDPTNLFNVMRQISITGLIALGMTFVILTAGIDLSVGSVLALAGIVAAAVAKGSTGNTLTLDLDEAAGHGWVAALGAAIGIGVSCGFLQGLGITRLKVPPFVVTLGGLSAFRGLTLWFSGGGPISGLEAGFALVGSGLDRARADPGHSLPLLRIGLPRSLAPHALWPPCLRGRRQSRGGAALRIARQSDHFVGLRHRRFLRRACRLRAGCTPELG